jgi:hypothetical protein
MAQTCQHWIIQNLKFDFEPVDSVSVRLTTGDLLVVRDTPGLNSQTSESVTGGNPGVFTYIYT